MRRSAKDVGILAVLVVGLAAGCGQVAGAGDEVSWPAARKGLVFSFETASLQTPMLVFDPDDKPVYSCSIAARARAKYDHHSAMVTTGGSFVAERIETYLGPALQKSGALTIEAYVSPAEPALAQSGVVLAFSSEAGPANFALVQARNKLVLVLRTSAAAEKQPPAQVELAALSDAKPFHLAVTYAGGVLVGYRDGKEVLRSAAVTGDFTNWTDGRLLFGDDWPAKQPWPGALEGIAVFKRALGADEVKQDAQVYLKKVQARPAVPIIQVRGKLLAKSPVPEYKQIQPYYQALAVYEYEVEKVLAGTCNEKKIRVAHWVMMEKKPLPAMADRPVGESYDLVLEPFAANLQLESQWLSNTLDPIEPPPYLDVAP
jgi:hypothetical protein